MYRRMGGGEDGSSGSGSGPPSVAGSDAARTPLTGRSPSQRSGGGSAREGSVGPRPRSLMGKAEGSDADSEYEEWSGEEEEDGGRRPSKRKSVHDVLICWPLGWPRMTRVEWQLCLLGFWFVVQLTAVILMLTTKQFPWEYDYVRDLSRGERNL